MSDTVERWSRTALWLLPAHAALLALATLTHQPDPTTEFRRYAEYVTTDAFLVSHLGASILGAALGIVGAFALLPFVAATARVRSGLLGAGLFTVGNVLVTAVFAAAAFAQPAIGRGYLAGRPGMSELNDDVYGAPLVATAVVGLLLLTAGGALVGRAAAALPRLRRAGTVYAWALPLSAVAGFVVPGLQPVAATVAAAAAVLIARFAGRRVRIR